MRTLLPALVLLLAAQAAAQAPVDQELEKLKADLADKRKTLGEEHPRTAAAYQKMGEHLTKKAKLTEAKPLLEKAIALNQKLLGPEHPTPAESHGALGRHYLAGKDKKKARPLLEKALAIYRKVLGTAHPRTKQAEAELKKSE